MSYSDRMFPHCAIHGDHVGDVCPRCDISTITAPKQPKKAVNSGLSVVGAIKPPKPKRWTKTSQELPIPIMKHGVLIHYIRQGKRDKQPRSYYYDGHWHSILELWFWTAWQRTGYPMPTPEYKFHPDRKWKLDFAWQDLKIAVEMEGGSHSGGRHTRGVGFKKDIEKYNEATALGWQLYRFADTKQENIEFMKARFYAIDELAKAG